MEEGNNDPDYWFKKQSSQSQHNWSTTEAYSGEKSLHINTETIDSLDFSHWAQIINSNIPVGKDVTLKAKIKSELSGEGISLVIRGDDTEDPRDNDGLAEQFITTYGKTEITGNFDWKEYTLKLENVESEIKSLTVFLIYLQNTTGGVYFDDITLTYD